MTQRHPITPPPDKIHNWLQSEKIGCTIEQIITAAAQWGADQELEACCKWTAIVGGADALRAARRPKPPSLAKRALHILGTHGDLSCAEHDTIRRALETLDD
jgi:hypothetical protein